MSYEIIDDINKEIAKEFPDYETATLSESMEFLKRFLCSRFTGDNKKDSRSFKSFKNRKHFHSLTRSLYTGSIYNDTLEDLMCYHFRRERGVYSIKDLVLWKRVSKSNGGFYDK